MRGFKRTRQAPTRAPRLAAGVPALPRRRRPRSASTRPSFHGQDAPPDLAALGPARAPLHYRDRDELSLVAAHANAGGARSRVDLMRPRRAAKRRHLPRSSGVTLTRPTPRKASRRVAPRRPPGTRPPGRRARSAPAQRPSGRRGHASRWRRFARHSRVAAARDGPFDFMGDWVERHTSHAKASRVCASTIPARAARPCASVPRPRPLLGSRAPRSPSSGARASRGAAPRGRRFATPGWDPPAPARRATTKVAPRRPAHAALAAAAAQLAPPRRRRRHRAAIRRRHRALERARARGLPRARAAVAADARGCRRRARLAGRRARRRGNAAFRRR